MEFLTKSNLPPLKNLYPCLATITVTPPGQGQGDQHRLSRRLSGSGGGDENALTRVISGNRRKSSFGAVARSGSPDGRMKSGESEPSGTWYWRVQAGVTDTHLVLLPLTQPPNSLLTAPPAPLSSAMPTHSTAHNATDPAVQKLKADEDSGFGGKIKNLFRRPSSTATSGDNRASSISTASTDPTMTEAVLDQTAKGEQLPSASANAMGATNVNASAELGWPGTINGDKLGAVVVNLQGVDKAKVHLGGGKKGEGSWVIVPITSNFANLVHGMLEPLGRNHHDLPRSGSIRFDFDKEWIGAKGEAELLHHYLTSAAANHPAQPAHHDRAVPQTSTFQVGAGHHSEGRTAPVSREIAPDE